MMFEKAKNSLPFMWERGLSMFGYSGSSYCAGLSRFFFRRSSRRCGAAQSRNGLRGERLMPLEKAKALLKDISPPILIEEKI